MTLHLLSYNNYYNRIIKREASLTEYIPYRLNAPVENVNFIPNNDITTTQIINWDYSDACPDYLIVADENTIKSRWFVIESERLRQGQYRLVLKRDLVVDFYDKLITAPCFIDRATLQDSDPYIFNDEGINFNQVKKSSTLLKDQSKSSWYVGYMANDLGDKAGTEITITRPGFIQNAIQFGTFSDLPDYVRPFIKGIEGHTGTNKAVYNDLINFEVSAQLINYPAVSPAVTYRVKNNTVLYASDIEAGVYYKTRVDVESYSDNTATAKNEAGKKIANRLYLGQNDLTNSLLSVNGYSKETGFDQVNDKYIYITDIDKYYKLTVQKGTSSNRRLAITGAAKNVYQTYIVSSSNPPTSFGTEGQDGIFWNFSVTDYYVQAELVAGAQASVTIPTDRNRLQDAPYTMFAIPRDTTDIYLNYTDKIVNNTPIAQKTVTELINTLGINQGEGGYIYDIQLLPYCPLRNFTSNDQFIVENLTEGTDYTWITDNEDNKLSIMVFPQRSTFSFTIDYSIPITNPKVQSQTEMYRLCSPNYSGVFEFNAAINRGVSHINVECTYKPFSPYIYLAPDFGGLYGKTFAYEQRGLVCGGDFSIPLVTDAWRQYELQNKNYQQIFDRQIQNLETNREVQREQEHWARIAGSFSALASGAGSGSIIGGVIPGLGPIGSLVGGTLGGIGAGVSSYLTAGKDIEFNERLYKENKSYQEDLFKLNIANIKAIPNSLARIGAGTANNPIFPFIEFYQATDEELSQFSDWLRYHGMKVGKIGTIQDYLKEDRTFIRGSLLRIEDIAEDTHLVNELAAEIREGVFI